MGEARCGAEKAIKRLKNKIIIPIVCPLSTVVYLRKGAGRDGWDPYLTRTGAGFFNIIICPKWRVYVILTRRISNHGPKVNKPYSFPRLQSES